MKEVLIILATLLLCSSLSQKSSPLFDYINLADPYQKFEILNKVGEDKSLFLF